MGMGHEQRVLVHRGFSLVQARGHAQVGARLGRVDAEAVGDGCGSVEKRVCAIDTLGTDGTSGNASIDVTAVSGDERNGSSLSPGDVDGALGSDSVCGAAMLGSVAHFITAACACRAASASFLSLKTRVDSEVATSTAAGRGLSAKGGDVVTGAGAGGAAARSRVRNLNITVDSVRACGNACASSAATSSTLRFMSARAFSSLVRVSTSLLTSSSASTSLALTSGNCANGLDCSAEFSDVTGARTGATRAGTRDA